MSRASRLVLFLILLMVGLPASGATPDPPAPPSQAPYALDHVLVKLEPGVQAEQALGQDSQQVLGRWRAQPVAPGRSAEETVDELVALPGVEEAELDYLIQVDPLSDPAALSHAAPLEVDDPGLPLQWHFPAVQLAEAWADSTGEGVVVAVVDSGVSKGGVDLDCHTFVHPYRAIPPGTPGVAAASDDHGHGTHVAGTVAQCTNNGTGVAGVAFDASLMPVKVLDNTGTGSTSWIAAGIDWARTHGADVINLSLGCFCTSTLMDEAIDAAVDGGIIVVAASGNDGAKLVSYPASHPHVIAVGATEFGNERAPYSNRGSALDLVAPGGNNDKDENVDGYADGVLQETCDIQSVACSGGWGYWFFQGTSMATPHVAGGAALLKSIAPGLDGADVEAILEATALDLGPSGFDTSYGNGLIQLHDAIQFLTEPDSSPPTWPGGASLGAAVSETTVELDWPEADDDKAVAAYRVYRDGSLVKKTTSEVTTTTVSGLKSLTEYAFSVRAEDLDGNLSIPLSTEITMPDIKAPTWPSSSDLSVSAYGEKQLTLIWSSATDDAGVVQYRVRVAGTTGILTSSKQVTLTGLEPGTPYQFEVLAADAAGNWSAPLSASLRTARAFLDTRGTTFYDDILWMSGEDITRGCNPPVNDLFCPDEPLTRGQMAAFVVRNLGLKANDHPGFLDVDPASTFAADIGKLATAGITRGCNPPANDRFCPDDPVTRAQMASFVVRMLGLTDNSDPEFADVPADSTFAADIGKLATAGITKGCNPPVNDRFCPDDSLTRGQLSAFFHRANS